MSLSRVARRTVLLVACLVAAFPLDAGFAGRDVIIPASARTQGAGTPPAQFYSTLWVTNLSSTTVANVDVSLLRLGQTNPSPRSVPVTIAPGETKKWENVLQALFGLTEGVAGAIRIVSNVPVLASSRTYDRPDGTDIKQAKGLFFGAIPASFAIRLGESAILQGVSQGSAAEDYRYNFGLVETTGDGTVVTVTLRSASGSPLASTDYTLGAREARQVNVGTLFPGIATDNARLEATVSGGTGAVLFYGTAVANGSQDSIGFEMSFKDSLLVESVDTAAAKNAANLSVSTVALARAVWDIAPRIGLTAAGKTVLAEIPFTAKWNETTQTWTVEMSLSTGQTAIVKIQFRDASGVPSKLYRANETNSIWVNGTAANGAFDLTLLGVKVGVANLTVSGTAMGSYQGVSGTATVTNLVIPKTAGAYPTTGTIVVQSDGITVTVTFDGTRYAQGAYEFRALTIRFTINLDTGEIVFL